MLIAFELLVEASEENKLDEFINNPKLTRNTASPESVSHNTPSRVERIETFQTPRTDRDLNAAFNSAAKSLVNSESKTTPLYFILE